HECPPRAAAPFHAEHVRLLRRKRGRVPPAAGVSELRLAPADVPPARRAPRQDVAVPALEAQRVPRRAERLQPGERRGRELQLRLHAPDVRAGASDPAEPGRARGAVDVVPVALLLATRLRLPRLFPVPRPEGRGTRDSVREARLRRATESACHTTLAFGAWAPRCFPQAQPA